MSDSRLREEICRLGRSLFERGLTPGSSGNISVKLDDGGYMVTPTNASLGFLDPAKLSRLDAQGKLVSGDAPTKEVPLHSALYQTPAGSAMFDTRVETIKVRFGRERRINFRATRHGPVVSDAIGSSFAASFASVIYTSQHIEEPGFLCNACSCAAAGVVIGSPYFNWCSSFTNASTSSNLRYTEAKRT